MSPMTSPVSVGVKIVVVSLVLSLNTYKAIWTGVGLRKKLQNQLRAGFIFHDGKRQITVSEYFSVAFSALSNAFILTESKRWVQPVFMLWGDGSGLYFATYTRLHSSRQAVSRQVPRFCPNPSLLSPKSQTPGRSHWLRNGRCPWRNERSHPSMRSRLPYGRDPYKHARTTYEDSYWLDPFRRIIASDVWFSLDNSCVFMFDLNFMISRLERCG